MSVVAPSKCHRTRGYMAAALSCIKAKNRCEFTGHQWQIDCRKLPLSFTIIILRNSCSRFMHTDRRMCMLTCICLCVRGDETGKKDDKKKRMEVTELARLKRCEKPSSLFKSRPLCLCVGFVFFFWCVCAWFGNPVHVWVCQNRATLPSSSHRSRFVSFQLQVTKWHCAFMAALHGASHKPRND